MKAKTEAAENRPTLDREAVETLILNWKHGDEPVTHVLADKILALAPAAEGWPEWLGPRVDPDDFEVYRDALENIRVDGEYFCGPGATPETVRDGYAPTVRITAKREAVARFIESEQAATDDKDQRVEEWAREAAHIMAQSACDELGQPEEVIDNLTERLIPRGRALVDAGWTPPEGEDK